MNRIIHIMDGRLAVSPLQEMLAFLNESPIEGDSQSKNIKCNGELSGIHKGTQTVVFALPLESYFIGSSCDGVDGTDNLMYIDALRFSKLKLA